jgi:hypothetical protein
MAVNGVPVPVKAASLTVTEEEAVAVRVPSKRETVKVELSSSVYR